MHTVSLQVGSNQLTEDLWFMDFEISDLGIFGYRSEAQSSRTKRGVQVDIHACVSKYFSLDH